MADISLNEFNLVTNVFSFTLSAMGACAAFMFVQRSEVLPKYRPVVAIMGLVTLIATYNYFRLYDGWTDAYTVLNGVVKATGHQYNDAFRYADWLMTVPLLMIGLVMVLDMPPRQAKLRATVLALQAAEMILLGYPGQIATDTTTRWLWWGASMVPFLIIVYQLFVSMAEAVETQPEQARTLVIAARFITVVVWCFYPIVYVLPLAGVTGSTAFIATQVGYAAADITAKAVYGVMIYMIAARKSDIERNAAALGEPARTMRRAA